MEGGRNPDGYTVSSRPLSAESNSASATAESLDESGLRGPESASADFRSDVVDTEFDSVVKITFAAQRKVCRSE
jgi:hypothetical protein